MRIFAFVDLHQHRSELKRIVSRSKKGDVDVVVCAGDFTIFSSGQDEILKELDSIGKPVLLVHGNHEDAGSVRDSCKRLKNCFFIHNGFFRKNSVLFVGWGGGGFSFRDQRFEDRSKKFFHLLKPDTRLVFVSHAPPYGTKCDSIHGQHAGNKSLRRFIERARPVLAVCGHLHETAGSMDKIKNTLVINPGFEGRVLEI